MPTNVVKTPEQEHKWNKAKAVAAKEGKTKDYPYIMGIFKKMGGLDEDAYIGLVSTIANDLIEVTATGNIAVTPVSMMAKAGNDAKAGAAANTPAAPESDGQVPAQVFINAGVPKTKVKEKRYVGEATNIADMTNLLLNVSQDDLENPLKKSKPTQLGIELDK